MKRQIYALLAATSPSPWLSCKTISENLKISYTQAASQADVELRLFKCPFDLDEAAAKDLAEQLRVCAPRRLVFVENLPHPVALLPALLAAYRQVGLGDDDLPELEIHVYGNFTIRSAEWKRLDPCLRHFRVRFFCASPRQRALVAGFLKKSKHAAQLLPFPLNEQDFYWSPSDRVRARKALCKRHGFARDTFLCLYAGRLSLQKNVDLLLTEFSKVCERLLQEGRETVLLLAGPYDDVAATRFGLTTPKNYYFVYLHSLLKQLPLAVRARVHFLGAVPGHRMRELYCASDAALSLSTFHDEDFGYAPAEALACGAPVVVSDWGGYAQFVRGAKVVLTPEGPAYDSRAFGEALLSVARSRTDAQAREGARVRAERSHKTLLRFGCGAVADFLLADMCSCKGLRKFEGFSGLMTAAAKAQKNAHSFAAASWTVQLYRKIFLPYYSSRKKGFLKRGYRLVNWQVGHSRFFSEHRRFIHTGPRAMGVMGAPCFREVEAVGVEHLFRVIGTGRTTPIILRDGFETLRRYFDSHQPRSLLLVPQQYPFSIPQRWKSFVGRYWYEDSEPKVSSAPLRYKKVLFVIPEKARFRLGSVAIKKLCAELKAKKKRGELAGAEWGYCFVSTHLCRPVTKNRAAQRLVDDLSSNLKTSLRPVVWMVYDYFSPQVGTLLVDLCDPMCWSDNYLLHLARSSGAHVFEKSLNKTSKEMGREVKRVPVSEFHLLCYRLPLGGAK